ncbi:MAG: CxxH/CxxC protein [Eubacteriales bacterium]
MIKKSKIFTCEEHIDLGIDDFVNHTKQAPNIEITKDNKCDYCEKKAAYKISLETNI